MLCWLSRLKAVWNPRFLEVTLLWVPSSGWRMTMPSVSAVLCMLLWNRFKHKTLDLNQHNLISSVSHLPSPCLLSSVSFFSLSSSDIPLWLGSLSLSICPARAWLSHNLHIRSVPHVQKGWREEQMDQKWVVGWDCVRNANRQFCAQAFQQTKLTFMM